MNDTGGGRRGIRLPPGFARTERRLLRLSEAWPAWGAALWLLLEVCLSSALQPWAAFGISTMAYLGMEAVPRAFSRRDRRLHRALDPPIVQASRASREVKATSMFSPGPSRDRKDC